MSAAAPNSCRLVRETTARVAAAATRCTIDADAVQKVVGGMTRETVHNMLGPREFDADGSLHFCDPADPDLTTRYLLAVDAINFCFWPDHDAIRPPGGTVGSSDMKDGTLATQGLEYEHVAGGLKRAVERDRGVLDADRLALIDGPALRALLGWPRPLPLEEERARLIREVGAGLAANFGGSAVALVQAAGGHAPTLVDLVMRTFPGFRDAVIDPRDGRQVYLCKRAQIFVGDVWGCFQGAGLGNFGASIGELTMFADYRVPVVLRGMGIMRYDSALAAMVDSSTLIAAGSAEELEIRACTVQAVEQMKSSLRARLAREPELAAGVDTGGPGVTSVAIDWFLWNEGEAMRDQSPPHHRTLTVFY